MSMTKKSFPKNNLIGKKFGRLLVTSFLYFLENKKNNRRYAIWSVTCDCGKVKPIKGNQLTSGGTISCGCALKEEYVKMKTAGGRNKKATGVHAFNSLVNSYKQRAKKHKLDYILSDDQFKLITSSNCYFCGVEPQQISPVPALRKRTNVNGYYVYNGIDRLDSSLGYVASNCVPCCEICNKDKRGLSIEEFKSWIKRLTKFQNQVT